MAKLLFLLNFLLLSVFFGVLCSPTNPKLDFSSENTADETPAEGGEDNRTFLRLAPNSSVIARRNHFGDLEVQSSDKANAARCYDSRLATYINNGLQYYSHNMGQLSKYVMDQIKRARYSGYWFVHAAMIGGQTQGLQWQSQSNGDIFSPASAHGCYYHDTQTYILILRY